MKVYKEVLFLLSMFLGAMAMFTGDLLVVAAIIGSMWFESQIGVSWGVILDTLLVVAVGCVVGAWIIGKLLQKELFGLQAVTRHAVPKSVAASSNAHPAAPISAAANGNCSSDSPFPVHSAPNFASGAHSAH